MRWKGRRKSSNVEDRRGQSGGGNIFGGSRRTSGGAGRISGGGKSMGCGGLILIIVLFLVFGSDMTNFIGNGDMLQQQNPQGQTRSNGYDQRQAPQSGQARPDDELAEFVQVVLAETEDVWNPIFQQQLGRDYREPTLVLFEGQVTSACGRASAATGPFYCPGDEKLYIDLSFYRELSQRFGAPGDFAMAYVVAHEVAHHVQNLLGITRQVQSQNGRIPEKEYNRLSVKLELQADFLSGVWARAVQKKGLLEDGDIEEALNAANAIGDDRIQKQARGYVVPDSFTHGTSAQRVKWFRRGFETGDISQGDTFSARDL